MRVASGLAGRAGKAPCAAQLAFSLAEDEALDVLLVEADLDEPTLHEVLDVRAPRGYGLSEQLKRMPQGSTRGVVTRIRLANRLDAMLEGSDGAPAFFGSPQLSALLAHEQRDYDFIVVNGPVLGHWPDTEALHGLASSFVYVRNAVQTDDPDARRAVSALFQNADHTAVIETGALDEP